MGVREQLPVGRDDVRGGGDERAPRGATVVARKNGCLWDENRCVRVAAGHGHEAVVRALIQAGAHVNMAIDEGVTPLSIAAHQGHETIVRVLIEASADVNKAANDGATPLYMAAHQGHEAVVRALIEASADVNKARDDGATPLFVAVCNCFEAIVQILRAAGAVNGVTTETPA